MTKPFSIPWVVIVLIGLKFLINNIPSFVKYCNSGKQTSGKESTDQMIVVILHGGHVYLVDRLEGSIRIVVKS